MGQKNRGHDLKQKNQFEGEGAEEGLSRSIAWRME